MQSTAQVQRPKRGARIIAEIAQALIKNMHKPIRTNFERAKRKSTVMVRICLCIQCQHVTKPLPEGWRRLFFFYGMHFASLRVRLLWRTIPPGFTESIQGLHNGLYSSGGKHV
jgi:hypothetical protein